MAPKVVRAKVRRARLTTAPADPHDMEQTEETQKNPTNPPPSSEPPQNASNEEETKASERPTGVLFRGHKFYLARTLHAERRAELRILITQNGGEVVPEMMSGSVEIVERGQLKPNENWVAAEFVEDSIQDGELKNVVQYMAPRVDKVHRTPSGRPPKRFFTVEEQAKMLRFLQDQFPKFYNRPTVPERIWKIAMEQQLIKRTSSSMHEHFRKQLAPLTNKERAVIFEKAGMTSATQDSIEGETEGETETEGERRTNRVTAKRDRDDAPPINADDEETKGEEEDDDEIQGRAKKRMKKTTTPDREDHAEEESKEPERDEQNQEDDDDDDAATVVIEEETAPPSHPTIPPPEPTEDRESAHEEYVEPEGNNEQVIEDKREQEEPETPSGEVFRSYWQGVASSVSTRHQLDRFFVPPPPPPPPPVEPSQATRLSPALRTPRRGSRVSQSTESPTPQATPTPQKRRRSGRFSVDSMSTPEPRTPARAAQQELLSQLEEMVGQRMTPPSRRKSLDRLIPVSQATAADADKLLARLQFETAHDANTVCSALYWSSGDSNVARNFLLGHLPAELWCPEDDQLLLNYIRDDITEVELANARHRGVFERMRTKRSARDILRRIQFLL